MFRSLLFPVVAILGLALQPACVAAGEKPPNIVLFFADDLGWTGLDCFGSDFYETPNLDRLAGAGMKFTDAYAACTVCSPSRAALMTGMYPARLRLTTFIPGQNRPYAKLQIPDWTMGLEPELTTIAEALGAGGYRTSHIGKWHLSFPGEKQDPTKHGFDFSQDKPAGTRGYHLSKKVQQALDTDSGYLTDYFAELAADQIAAAGEDPFFLYFAFHVPHTPIQGRADLVEAFKGKVDAAALHQNPTYAAMVKSMDQAVGRVVAALDAAGKAEDTIIIFTSDNGGLTQRYGKHDGFTENLPLRRGKGSAYEGGVRVPTIVRWPGVTAPGSVCDEPVMGIDFYPTLLEVAGLAGDPEHNKKVDGRSLVPLLKNADTTLDRDLFWHFPHYHAGGDSPYSAIRSGDWRLIEFHEDGALELYHLSDDLGEQDNLASRKGDLAKRLQQKLHAWRTAVGAQMPKPNPNFDPARQTQVARGKRKK